MFPDRLERYTTIPSLMTAEHWDASLRKSVCTTPSSETLAPRFFACQTFWPELSNKSISFLREEATMRNIDPHRPSGSPRGTDDESWTFIPVIVCVAALCLVLFFLTPTFDNQSNGARSARPGAATSTTAEERTGSR